MFTGIVEEVGRVASIEQRGENRRIIVAADRTPNELSAGASVSVSGVCLTALNIEPGRFSADLAPETWVRTSFSRIHEGALVNLELPMKADGRFGGHIVQGHVDGTGEVVARTPSEHWEVVRIEVPAAVARYIVEKGSITVDGISLTVSGLGAEPRDWFEVSLIPTTRELTTLGRAPVGTKVNLEVDVIAKYVERLLQTTPS